MDSKWNQTKDFKSIMPNKALLHLKHTTQWSTGLNHTGQWCIQVLMGQNDHFYRRQSTRRRSWFQFEDRRFVQRATLLPVLTLLREARARVLKSNSWMTCAQKSILLFMIIIIIGLNWNENIIRLHVITSTFNCLQTSLCESSALIKSLVVDWAQNTS